MQSYFKLMLPLLYCISSSTFQPYVNHIKTVSQLSLRTSTSHAFLSQGERSPNWEIIQWVPIFLYLSSPPNGHPHFLLKLSIEMHRHSSGALTVPLLCPARMYGFGCKSTVRHYQYSFDLIDRLIAQMFKWPAHRQTRSELAILQTTYCCLLQSNRNRESNVQNSITSLPTSSGIVVMMALMIPLFRLPMLCVCVFSPFFMTVHFRENKQNCGACWGVGRNAWFESLINRKPLYYYLLRGADWADRLSRRAAIAAKV